MLSGPCYAGARSYTTFRQRFGASDTPGASRPWSGHESELYFLIARFLENGPCNKTAELLVQELEQKQLFPKRLDLQGNENSRNYKEMVASNGHVAPELLLQICKNMNAILNQECPTNVSSQTTEGSLLITRKQSTLLRSKARRNFEWKRHLFATLQRGRPPEIPTTCNRVPNIVDVLRGRQLTGAARFSSAVPVNLYEKMKIHRRVLGHLSSVYCVAFDRTGRRIFTGSDDYLLKIWSTFDGRLLATLRGHSSEITDITVNYENTMIAAGCCEKVIRVWYLRTLSPVAVLQGHTGSVTSLAFSPFMKESVRYLVSTGSEGTLCVWKWDVNTRAFDNNPLKFNEKSRPGAQMLCCSYSAGGMFMAAGNTDHAIRMYYFGNDSPEKLTELEGHTGAVDSIQFCNSGERFVSGSKDGTARIWHMKEKSWKNIVLDMTTVLEASSIYDAEQFEKPQVLMITWDRYDSIVVTAISTHLIKVWDSLTGQLLRVLTGHQNDIYVLEAHPLDSRMILSAGYDGKIFLWDITNGTKTMQHFNMIAGQGHGAILDCKISSDGQFLASTDSHGHLLIFGYGSSKPFEKIPDQMFFHTDYRPLRRDAKNFVLDEQTQQAPHLMPPPFLVDVDGNPHPPSLQRLVPGRENCADGHLIPQLGYMERSDGEVVEQVISQQINFDPQSTEPNRLDGIIRQLQQNQEQEPGSSRQSQLVETPRRDHTSPPNVGLRRSGQVEGVRQMHQNSPLSQIATEQDILAWRNRVVVPEVPAGVSRREEGCRLANGQDEKALYTRHDIPHIQDAFLKAKSRLPIRKDHPTVHTSYRNESDGCNLDCSEDEEESSNSIDTRRGQDFILYETSETANINSDFSGNEDEWTNKKRSTGESSSEYSDWTAEAGINLQPPTRTLMRRRPQRLSTTSEDESSSAEQTSPKRGGSKPRNVDGVMSAIGIPPINREISNDYRPPVWITDTTARRSPFVPQMGDEVIYFRQGHEAYINAVKRNNLCTLNLLKEPWKQTVLRDQELVKIVGIRYEIGPPTLCCLKLTLLDHFSGKLTDQSFSLKYHDMPDVIDFFVLRQFFDYARKRNWQAGDKFRSIIDDVWWFGTILSQEPYQAEYPDSLFQSYNVKWDNTEIERLSPWDMDVIPENVLQPDEPGTSVSVSPDEVDNLRYTPQEGEWGFKSRDEECERIICGIDQLLNSGIATAFAAPVDLHRYPAYCMYIAYPTDLSTIRMRLVNRFYRRISALVWEVRYIEMNAVTFNEPDSNIAKAAKKITDLLLMFIANKDCANITDLCNTIDKGEEFWLNKFDEKTEGPKASCENVLLKNIYNEDAWKQQCLDLVNFVIECEDSEPFREPVDLEQYSDYTDIIDTPMDFGTIKQQLQDGEYSSPLDLNKHMRLVFSNAKLYTPNKRSRIYSMALRLSALVEEKMKVIVADYKAAQKYKKTLEKKCHPCNPSRQGSKHTSKKMHFVSIPKNVKQMTNSENGVVLEHSTSRGVTYDSDHPSVGHVHWRRPCAKPQGNVSAQATIGNADTDMDSSSSSLSTASGNETEDDHLELSTSSSKHSTRLSFSSDSEEADSATPRVNGLKNSKGSNQRRKKPAFTKKVSQGSNKKRPSSKRRYVTDSDERHSPNTALKDTSRTRKKLLRKSAALAANKIKCMSDVDNRSYTSDSDCSAGKNSRTLPHRTAAAKAKQRILDDSEDENGLSDSDHEVESKRASRNRQSLSSKTKSKEDHLIVVTSSHSYSDASQKCRILPRRAAAVEAKKHLLDGSEEECEKIKLNAMVMNPYVLMPPNVVVNGETSDGISDDSVNSPPPNQPAEPEFSVEESVNKDSDQNVDKLSLSDSDSQPPPDTSQQEVSDSQSESCCCVGKEINNTTGADRKSRPTKHRVSRKKIAQPLSSVSKQSTICGRQKSTSVLRQAQTVTSDSDSESYVKRKILLKRAPVSPPSETARNSKDSEEPSNSGTEEGSYCTCSSSSETAIPKTQPKKSCSDSESSNSDSSNSDSSNSDSPLSDSNRIISKKTNGKKSSSRSTISEQKRKRSRNSCDDDWKEDCPKRRKLTHRTKMRTRNQGKRTVQYEDGDGNHVVQSDRLSRSVHLRKMNTRVRAQARRFLY